MNTKKSLFILGLLILVSIGVFYFSKQVLTGRTIEREMNYSYTKAICNKTESGEIYCEDYEIYCQGNKIAKIKATGFSVNHPQNWEDPRGEKGNEITCEQPNIG